MKRYFFFTFLIMFYFFPIYAETYNQVQNRFTLWYRSSVWEKLDEKVSIYINNFNNDKTRDNAALVIVWACARYAYWMTARQTAEVLYEQLGDRYGQWKYSKIFEQASNLEKQFSDQCYDLELYFLENYPEWDFSAERRLGLHAYYGDLFKMATKL